MRDSFTSEATAQQHGLTAGYHYWFGRPRAADLPYNRVLVPAAYLISSAEDLTHFLIAQLNDGVYQTTSVLSPAGVRELHRPGVPPERGTSYAMGWYVGPVNGIPAIYHQGEVYNHHANVVLVPESRRGVVVLMNAQNSLDLLVADRMKAIADGVTSLPEGREPPPPPSNTAIFLIYAFVFAVIVLQVRGMIRSVGALRQGRLPRGRIGTRWRIGLSLAVSLAWALLILVLVPRQLGPPLLVLARPIPDLTYILLVSAIVAIGWGIARAIWAYAVLRKAENNEKAARMEATK
jgi:Beta-lactamase